MTRELEELALAVADGDAVDWSRVLDAAEDPAAIHALRLLEAIADGYAKGPGAAPSVRDVRS